MEQILSAIESGLILAVLAYGVYISFRILNAPDMTIDGTFSLGALIMTMLMLNQTNPFLILLGFILAFIGGCLGGLVTAFLATKLKVNMVLSGILTMTALYTINLRLFGEKNNAAIEHSLFFNFYQSEGIIKNICLLALIVGILLTALLFFFKSRLGSQIRATGDNEQMIEASSVNPAKMKTIALAMSNGLSALSGALFVGVRLSYVSTLGDGKFVMAVASIIIGEAILYRKKGASFGFVACIIGSVIYQILFACALMIGAKAVDLKLISTIIIVSAISIPVISKFISERRMNHANN